jgi:hypothetical protein
MGGELDQVAARCVHTGFIYHANAFTERSHHTCAHHTSKDIHDDFEDIAVGSQGAYRLNKDRERESEGGGGAGGRENVLDDVEDVAVGPHEADRSNKNIYMLRAYLTTSRTLW